jgi:hypothetical protein
MCDSARPSDFSISSARVCGVRRSATIAWTMSGKWSRSADVVHRRGDVHGLREGDRVLDDRLGMTLDEVRKPAVHAVRPVPRIPGGIVRHRRGGREGRPH